MQGQFNKEQVYSAADSLLQEVVTAGVIKPEAAPIFQAQLAICADLVLRQTPEQWAAVPDGATPDQLLIIVYLFMTDQAMGTNYVERLFSGETGTSRMPTLDDLTGFQA